MTAAICQDGKITAMTALCQPALAEQVADAARVLGRRGGRPKGSFSSPVSIWLRAEARQRRLEGYKAREAFSILRDSEDPDGGDAFWVKDWTADEHDLDIGTRVTWDNFRKLWSEAGNGNRFP